MSMLTLRDQPGAAARADVEGRPALLSDAEVDAVTASTVKALRAAAVLPAPIYSYERTGLLVTCENRRLMPAADIDEWEDTIAEYEELHPEGDWKQGLQEIANKTGLRITVAHYPTGASKWNPVEHRLFGPISINWADDADRLQHDLSANSAYPNTIWRRLSGCH
jgi:hypothetical protein